MQVSREAALIDFVADQTGPAEACTGHTET